MPRFGNDARPDVTEANTQQRNQQGNRHSVSERIRVTELGAWIKGWNGSATYRHMIWRHDGAILYQSPSDTVSSAGVGTGNLSKVTRNVSPPLELDAGDDIVVGFWWAWGDGLQTGYHNSGANHFDKSSSSGVSGMNGASQHGSTGPIGAWAEYVPIAGAWVRRSGAWERADSVSVRRGGAWEEVDTVSVRRSGSWQEAD